MSGSDWHRVATACLNCGRIVTRAPWFCREACRVNWWRERARLAGESVPADDDDPEWDCTDYAHPAWWRGNDAAVRSVCQLINRLIDEPERACGGHASEPWESTRQRIAGLALEVRRLRDQLRIAEQGHDE